MPTHGTIDVQVAGPGIQSKSFEAVGERASVWEGEPSAVYVPIGSTARLGLSFSATAEVFIAGARFNER